MKWTFDRISAWLVGRRKHRVQLTEQEVQRLTQAAGAPRLFLHYVARRAVELGRKTSQEQENIADAATHLAMAGDLEEARKLAGTISRSEMRDRALSKVAEAYARAGDVPKALELLQAVRSRPLNVRSLCAELARLGRIEDAIALTESFEEEFDREAAVGELASIACASGGSARFVARLEQVPNAKVRNAGISALAKVLAEAGKIKESLTAAAHMTEGHRFLLDEVAEILKRAGRLREFIAAAPQLQETPIREAAISLAVELLVQEGEYSEAVEFANLFGSASPERPPCRFGDFPPHALCENTLLLAEEIQSDKFREVFLWGLAVSFMKANETPRLVEATKRLLQPRSRDFVLNALANVSLNYGRFEDAAGFASQIADENLRQKIEERLSRRRREAAAEALEQPAEALERLKREVAAAEDFNLRAGKKIGKVVLRSLAEGATGIARSALGVANLLDSDSSIGGEFECRDVGSRMASQGRVGFLLDSLSVIRNADFRDAMLTGAAEELAGIGDLELACECASRVRGMLAEMTRHGAWVSIVSKLEIGKKPREFEVVIGRLKHRPHRDQLRIAAAKTFLSDGDLASGKAFLAQVEDPQARTSAVAESHISTTSPGLSVEEALEFAEFMEEGNEQALFLQFAASEMQAGGRSEDAFRVAGAVRDPFGRMLATFAVSSEAVRDYARNGQIDLALQTAGRAKDESVRGHLQVILLEEMLRTGNTDRLMEVLELTLAIAKRFKMAEETACILVSVATGLACRKTQSGIVQVKESFTFPEQDFARRTLAALEK